MSCLFLFNKCVIGPRDCGKTFAALRIANYISARCLDLYNDAICSTKSTTKNISILDCSDTENTKQSLETILNKASFPAESSNHMAITMSIFICKNVDINSKNFQQHLLPIMKHQIHHRSIQTFFLITTNSKYGGKYPFQNEVTLLSFHQRHQNQLVINEMNNYPNRQMLPESGSFLGFFLRRKVIELETSDIIRYYN